MPQPSNPASLAEALGLLGEPERLALLWALREGPAQEGRLAKALGLEPERLMRHLQLLLAAGWLQVEVKGQARWVALRSPELGAWLAEGARLWAGGPPERRPASPAASSPGATAPLAQAKAWWAQRSAEATSGLPYLA